MTTKINPGIPLKVVTGAIGVGVAASLLFCVPVRPAKDYSIYLQAILTGAFTALLGNVEASLDGGVTYSAIWAWDLLNNPVLKAEVPVGAILRINITTFTAGVSVDVLVGS